MTIHTLPRSSPRAITPHEIEKAMARGKAARSQAVASFFSTILGTPQRLMTSSRKPRIEPEVQPCG